MPVINVDLGARTYPIIVGSDLLFQLEKYLKRHVGEGRLFVFYDAQVFALHGPQLQRLLKRLKLDAIEMVIPVGERSKSAVVLNKIYSFLFDVRISRSDFILACGGGVTSDLVGYAAATALRGIRWGIVSTTLLGMVDAAIGGKTGINHPCGKNMIGAFWQPTFVFCDTSFLKTLPIRQVVAGLGEVVKYGALVGDKMIIEIERYLSCGDYYDDKRLSKLVHLSARCKADIVATDERESGPRMLLNLGHTFAHAIENAVGYGKLLHGEAVTLGLLAAVELSCLLKPLSTKYLSKYRRIVERMIGHIPYRKINFEKTLAAMQQDKKRAGAKQRFVLLEKPGRPFIAGEVSDKLVVSSLEKSLTVYKSEGGTHAPNPGR